MESSRLKEAGRWLEDSNCKGGGWLRSAPVLRLTLTSELPLLMVAVARAAPRAILAADMPNGVSSNVLLVLLPSTVD